jgi:hypothetical protein
VGEGLSAFFCEEKLMLLAWITMSWFTWESIKFTVNLWRHGSPPWWHFPCASRDGFWQPQRLVEPRSRPVGSPHPRLALAGSQAR